MLRPVDEAARQTLQTTFDDVMKMRKDVLDTLLTTTADREMFRKVYPFSPALVQTLIAVSAALQRERTALKLMLQLLVDRHWTWSWAAHPVGDLYDAPSPRGRRAVLGRHAPALRQREAPVQPAPAAHAGARQHGVTWEAIKLRPGRPDGGQEPAQRRTAVEDTAARRAGARKWNRSRGLTARLAALNHGTFRSPIPGARRRTCCAKCRDWASEIG